MNTDTLGWIFVGLAVFVLGYVLHQIWTFDEPPRKPPVLDRLAAWLDACDFIVADWRNAWRWVSTNAMVIAGALTWAWANLPDWTKPYIPHWLPPTVVTAVLALGVIGRIVKQAPNPPPGGDP